MQTAYFTGVYDAVFARCADPSDPQLFFEVFHELINSSGRDLGLSLVQ